MLKSPPLAYKFYFLFFDGVWQIPLTLRLADSLTCLTIMKANEFWACIVPLIHQLIDIFFFFWQKNQALCPLWCVTMATLESLIITLCLKFFVSAGWLLAERMPQQQLLPCLRAKISLTAKNNSGKSCFFKEKWPVGVCYPLTKRSETRHHCFPHPIEVGIYAIIQYKERARGNIPTRWYVMIEDASLIFL